MEVLLECPLCLAPFDDPRLLPCAHTLCLKCVQELMSTGNPAGKKCPMDRTDLPASLVPDTLPKNYLCAAMLETIAKEKSSPAAAAAGSSSSSSAPAPSKQKAVACECGKEPATVWCTVCGDLCKECSAALHSRPSFKSHSVVDQKDKKQQLVLPNCQKHPHNKTDLYCPQCAVLVCHLCERSGHVKHGCLAIDDAATAAKEKLKKTVKPFTSRKDRVTKKVTTLTAEIEADSKRIKELEVELVSLKKKVAAAEEEKDAYAAQLGKVDDTYRSLVKTIEDTNALDVLDGDHMKQMEEVFKKLYKSLYNEELNRFAPCSFDKSTASSYLAFSNNDLTITNLVAENSIGVAGNANPNTPFSWKFKINTGRGVYICLASPPGVANGLLRGVRLKSSWLGGFFSGCKGIGFVKGRSLHPNCPGWKEGDIVGLTFDGDTLSFIHNDVVETIPFDKVDWTPAVTLPYGDSVTLVTDA